MILRCWWCDLTGVLRATDLQLITVPVATNATFSSKIQKSLRRLRFSSDADIVRLTNARIIIIIIILIPAYPGCPWKWLIKLSVPYILCTLKHVCTAYRYVYWSSTQHLIGLHSWCIALKLCNNKLCTWWHNMPRPPCKLTISSYLFARWRCCSGITTSLYLFARWHLFQHVGCLRHQQQVDLWPFDLESGVLVTCDMGYLCANLTLPRPLCSRVRPDVCDRQATDRRQTKALLNASTLWGGDITIISATFWHFNRSLWRRVSPVNQMQFIFGQVILKKLRAIWSNTNRCTNYFAKFEYEQFQNEQKTKTHFLLNLDWSYVPTFKLSMEWR